MTLARHIMESDVVTVSPEASLHDVYALFDAESISGAPVVDARGELVGVISSRDLVRVANESQTPAGDSRRYYRSMDTDDERQWLIDLEPQEAPASDRSVRDVMTRDIISVPIDASVQEMASLMVANHIHRVLVIDEERHDQLVGIVSIFDLVELLR